MNFQFGTSGIRDVTVEKYLRKYGGVEAQAQEIAGLLKDGQRAQAMALRDHVREGRSTALNDALDRMIGNELRSPAIPHKDASASVHLDRLAQVEAPQMPDTDKLTGQQKFDVYASIVHMSGSSEARDALARGDAVILGLRKETNTVENKGKGEYDDRIVVLRRDNKGGIHVDEFKHASTEPTAQYDGYYKNSAKVKFRRAEGSDINGDRVRDMGRLASGTIEMGRASHKNPRSAGTKFSLRPTPDAVKYGKNGVERDTNHDGLFDAKDVGRDDLNRTFKIHSGSKHNTDSAGCQTIHPTDFKHFEAAATANKGQDKWQYVLTDVAP